jgi:cell division protein FtsX
MKFIISILLIALLSFVSCLYLPWWSVAIAAFIVIAFINQRSWKAFLTGFTGVFLLWGVLAWYISSRNEHLLAHKVSIVMIQSDNVPLLIILTALIGGVIGGLGALTGSYLKKN